MGPKKAGWDWWSEVKLKILQDYLNGFTTAVTGKSAEVIYLDLFAGSYDNQRRHLPGSFPGSARLGLEASPPFTRIALCELPEPAARLREDILSSRPDDDRWSVFPGDCNDVIGDVLKWLEPVRWAPTFAFLDPRGLQVAWKTVEALADWRRDRKTKVEQWILFPEPALSRVLGLQGVQGQRSAEKLDRLFGTREWLAIHQLRRMDQISPDETRAEFVNLLRWRLETVLGYKTTHALQIVNTAGHPVYTMVFATDSPAGDRIMKHVYEATATQILPEMMARAQGARNEKKVLESGVLQLPGFDFTPMPQVSVGSYGHVPPWKPPAQQFDDFEFDVDVDPDDIDPEAWADSLED